MRTGTIENRTQVYWGARAAGTGKAASGFAARMEALTDAMTLSDPAEDPTMRAAWEQLSEGSKDVVERMKAGRSDVTQEEWTQLCRELKDAGLISESDFAFTRGDLRAVPLMTDGMKDGCAVVSGGDDFPLLSRMKDPDWSGDPLKFLDMWMQSLRDERVRAAATRLSDGSKPVQYMNALASSAGSCEKVSGLVRDLMAVC